MSVDTMKELVEAEQGENPVVRGRFDAYNDRGTWEQWLEDLRDAPKKVRAAVIKETCGFIERKRDLRPEEPLELVEEVEPEEATGVQNLQDPDQRADYYAGLSDGKWSPGETESIELEEGSIPGIIHSIREEFSL